MGKIKKNKRHVKRLAMPQISLTPLIDTALTLLVIFMITAPIIQNGIKVDLPQGKSKEVASQQDLVITMCKDGQMLFNSYKITQANLVESVKKALVQKNDIPVYIKADKELSYGQVIKVVDQLKYAGVKYVAMSTRAFT